MKKTYTFIAIIVAIIALIGALVLVINVKDSQKLDSEDNPYGDKEDLEQATIDQIGDKNYGNQIMPDELEGKLDNDKSVTVYFYSPNCPYCQQLTPDLVPLAQKMDVDLKKFNLLEFQDGFKDYKISGTPTVIHFEDGEEVDRIEGLQSEDVYEDFFNQYVVDDKSDESS